MPDGWTPNFEAFQDGLEVGIYAGLAVLVVLIFVSAVRRVVGV
jgi:hypothetical protein